jgi:hypothetical protein
VKRTIEDTPLGILFIKFTEQWIVHYPVHQIVSLRGRVPAANG